MPVTTPVVETVASAVLDDDHVAELVTSCVVPSDIVAVAVNCDEVPTVGTDPVTTTDETIPDGEVVLHPTTNTARATMMTNEGNHRNMNFLPCDWQAPQCFARGRDSNRYANRFVSNAHVSGSICFR